MEKKRLELADEFLRRFAGAVRSAQLYSTGHPIIGRSVDGLLEAAGLLHASQPSVTIGIVGTEVVVDDVPIGRLETYGDIVRRLQSAGIERVVIERGVEGEEIVGLVKALTPGEGKKTPEVGTDSTLAFPSWPHVRVGRIQVEDRVVGDHADMSTIRRLYTDAVSAAGIVWESATTEGKPDADAARAMVDGLAQAVSQNRTALIALTALREYDNYTFTHMVNVSILTMAQARGLGIDGPLLRECGLAALMHDIGKVKTPPDVLNKPDRLTDAEFAIMKRHTIDGAEMLRGTPEISALAPVVAFEHHLRLDGTGYPTAVTRSSLNLCTMMCSIADVYDAMRSQRRYQQAYPSERVLEVLKHNDGVHFDRHLVRRFTQLIGIYPAGNLVRLDTGEVAVVIKAYAPDPFRPQVRVLFHQDGHRLDLPYDVNLWETASEGRPSSVQGPVDQAEYGLDPLAAM